MKANYKYDKELGQPIKEKLVLTKEEVSKYLEAEWEEKRDEVYSEVKNDVANQILSVFFTVLHNDFGFGKKRLLKLKDNVEAQFLLMTVGIFGNPYTPVDCLNYLKKEFGIDLDKEELFK